jgi:hypothetical protein
VDFDAGILIHFDTTNATEQTTVELQNVFCFDIGLTFAAADITALAGGQVTCRQGGSTFTNHLWIDPISQAPGSPVYEVKRDAVTWVGPSIALTGPASGVWTPVTSNPSWEITCSTTLFGPIIIREGFFTVSIRKGSGPVIDTAVWTLSIECATLN